MVGRRLMCNRSWGAVVGMLVEGLGFGFVPQRRTRWLSAARCGFSPITKHWSHFTMPQWRRDDTRPLILAMREIIRGTIDFQAPRCFV